MIKAVLFDLDGVITDSEVFDQQVSADFIRENHLKSDPAIFHVWIGANPQLNLWSEIVKKIDPADDPATFGQRLHEYHDKRFAALNFADIMFPEVKGVISDLRQRELKLACCSSSAPAYIDKALTECGLKDCFDLIVSGRDFKASKPAPDIYLYAAARFGLTSRQCLVIEDSRFGIASGKAAGMTVLARRDIHFGIDQSQADYLFDALGEIETFLPAIPASPVQAAG